MTGVQLDALEMNMPRLKAIDMLDRARAGEVELSADQWQSLTVLETGSKEMGEAAKMMIRKSRMRANQPTD